MATNLQFRRAVLVALVMGSLSLGIWRAFQPGGANDLQRVAVWSGDWARGIDVYAPPSVTDYPPWALVSLSPLALVPPVWRAPLWVLLSLALVAVVAWRLADVSGEVASIRLELALLLAATACLHALTQFSLLAFALGLVGALAPGPASGGVLVGLSLMKPQIGGVIWLWLTLRGEWRRALVALAVPAVLTAVFLIAVRVPMADLAREYAGVIAIFHGLSGPLLSHSDLQAWLRPLWPHDAGSARLVAGLLVVLLAPAIAAVRRGRLASADRGLELLALCGAAALLAMRHLSYDFLLLLLALVAWRCPPFAGRPPASPRLFFGVAGLMIAAVPSWTRLAVSLGAPAGVAVLAEFDRVMCLGAWAALSVRLNRADSLS
jgi:hypothetical protein